MTIIEALKSRDLNLRLSNGQRWLVWQDGFGGYWQVYEKKRRSKHITNIINTEVEEQAVAELLKG